MPGKIALLSLLPSICGCIVVRHEHSLFNFGEFAGPLTDAGLTGRLIVIAAGSGGLGGVVVWLAMKARRRWTPLPPENPPAASQGAAGFYL